MARNGWWEQAMNVLRLAVLWEPPITAFRNPVVGCEMFFGVLLIMVFPFVVDFLTLVSGFGSLVLRFRRLVAVTNSTARSVHGGPDCRSS